MDNDPISFRLADKFLEILLEMLDYIRADGVCLLASLTPIG